jgi:hypothetical protein
VQEFSPNRVESRLTRSTSWQNGSHEGRRRTVGDGHDCNRYTPGPRRPDGRRLESRVRTTVALTVLSFVPDLSVPDTAASSRIVLMTAHVVAAAIVIPVVARRLSATR